MKVDFHIKVIKIKKDISRKIEVFYFFFTFIKVKVYKIVKEIY